jgi:hypothetical protein
MKEIEWYYELKGRQCGPVSEADIRALIEYGTVDANTVVWSKGSREWIPVQDTKLGEYITYDMPPPLPGAEHKRSTVKAVFSLLSVIAISIFTVLKAILIVIAKNVRD